MKKSVIMAVYNGEKFLVDQLDSIKMQSVKADEVLFGDDGSTDGSVQLINEYIERYSLQDSWRVIVNKNNLGYANNFNSLLNAASGDYIFLADQDDIWELKKIEIMSDFMDKQVDCQLLCCDYQPYFMDGINGSAPSDVIARMKNDASIEKNIWNSSSIYLRTLGCCMCVRKDFVKATIKYWYDRWAQDDRLWRLAQCVDGCYTIHTNLIKHRIHGSNTCTYETYHTKSSRLKRLREMQAANEQMLQFVLDAKDCKKIKIMKNHIKSMDLRLNLLTGKNYINGFKLIGYLDYYEKKKSYLVEWYLSLKWFFRGE